MSEQNANNEYSDEEIEQLKKQEPVDALFYHDDRYWSPFQTTTETKQIINHLILQSL